MYLRAAGGFARKKTHDGSATGFTQKRHTLYRLLYRIFHGSASSFFSGESGEDPELRDMHVAQPAHRTRQFQKRFPDGKRERRTLPVEKFFASKGLQRVDALFVDFPYALVGVPPVFGALAGSSHCLPCPLLCRVAQDGCARVRPQDGVSQCRLYIIMYSRAVESKALWKTVPRHTCRAPFCRS